MRRYDAQTLVASLAKFSLVGGTGVIVNEGVLLLMHGLGNWDLLVASPVAVELATIHNFVLNNYWTFGVRELSARRFLQFNLVSLGGLGINVAVLHLLEGYGLHYLLANLVGIALAMVWNFTLNVIWTWHRED